MRITLQQFSIFTLTSAVLITGVAFGQGRGGSSGWTTSRGDAQRSAWVRTDAYISPENLQKPGFGLMWSVKVGHTPRETISEGVSVNTAQLNPQPGNVTGSANNLYAYEIDTGNITWTKHFDAPAAAASTPACPGGLTAGVTRPTTLNQIINGGAAGRAGGGRGGAQGGVGAPGEGVPAALMVGRGGGGRAASGRAGGLGFSGGGGGGGGGGGLRGTPMGSFVMASDGMLYTVGQAQGKDIEKPVRFVPAGANATDLIAVDGTVYTSTINNCGGVANGVWSVNLSSGAVSSWKSGVSPTGPVAFAPSGTLYVAIGAGTAAAGSYSDAVVALDPQTLKVKDWFTMPGASFSSIPVVFSHGGREMVAAATKDGRVFVLDATSLGGSDHKTALAVSAATTTSKTWSPSALATWEDASQARWLALPAVGANGGIVAFKVTGDSTKPSLQQAWTSAGNWHSPSAPVVVNGVVFALDNGNAATPTSAVLYAMDASTGKELWNSGKAIKSSVRSGLWSISGQVYVATADAMIYAFGTSQGRLPAGF